MLTIKGSAISLCVLIALSLGCPSPAQAASYTVQENRAWDLIQRLPDGRLLASKVGKAQTVGLMRYTCFQFDSGYSSDDLSQDWIGSARSRGLNRAQAFSWVRFGAAVLTTAVSEICPWNRAKSLL